ncbi:MAG: efflux RND transporter permease subunit [Myxococcales bacterium FL481]|nr:MAG: efflux RND transporter permease subunit [Myxococcales bacterium FL481]
MQHSTDNGLWARCSAVTISRRFVVFLLAGILAAFGLASAPFAWSIPGFPRSPVPVDAIPDVGENQQIVFTAWPGRSPRDVEDQVTYPLTTLLLGMPGVKSVRSTSAFGFSSVYVIFEDNIEFYWSRSRIVEKLAALRAGELPPGVTPTLGPDATALGQVFWYTLEGQDESGRTVGGWDQHELRAIQDWTVRFALQAVPGVAEVASIGGFVSEFQVDVDPDLLRDHDMTLDAVANAVRDSNVDIGARTIEINRVEYVVRSIGTLEHVRELEDVVVATRRGVVTRVRDVAHVTLGPAARRGALDDAGAPAVGGVVVARFGGNPMEIIETVKARIAEIEPGLPSRRLADGTLSRVRIVPFYDRSQLIERTLETLWTALRQQLLVTAIVVIALLRSLRGAGLVVALVPLGVLTTFVVMRVAGVDANLMALSGIAIAIGVMVDVGIVVVENTVRRWDEAPAGASRAQVVAGAAGEVAPAIATAVLTTVLSFLPVFGLGEAEARLFGPLVYTKTFAMVIALGLGVILLPPLAYVVLRRRTSAVADGGEGSLGRPFGAWIRPALVAGLLVGLAADWQPLGVEHGTFANLMWVSAMCLMLIAAFAGFRRGYPALLRWCLTHKGWFAVAPLAMVAVGGSAWLGARTYTQWLPAAMQSSPAVERLEAAFPGLGREYMPAFEEGSFLYMPTTMPHASFAQVLEYVQSTDAAIAAIPEVERVVGKIGRVDSALDPAPISMLETMVTYVPEYTTDDEGDPIRQWRDHIRSPDDIWSEVLDAAARPGLTSAPRLRPIAGRVVMLQTGMRAPMGLKVQGPTLAAVERFGMAVEAQLRHVPELRAEAVAAERLVGKPYLEIRLDREALGRHGLTVARVQRTIETAIGGRAVTWAIDGRQRHAVRLRYAREERDSVEALRRLVIHVADGHAMPLEDVARIDYAHGPQMIRSEDTFLTSYVLFDAQPGVAEVDAVEAAEAALRQAIADGDIEVPAGVSFRFAGTYEQQVRSEARLRALIPITIGLVLVVLHLQFGRLWITAVIGAGVLVAQAGAFILLWCYGQPWFLDLAIGEVSLRELFRVDTVHLSVAVWVGLIALVGVATDDGVVMATLLRRQLSRDPPTSLHQLHQRVIEAGTRRIRPCLMTTATTLLALLPVVTARGSGSEIMLPMALPTLGGMAIATVTLFVVPVLYAWVEERRVRPRTRGDDSSPEV